MSSDTLTFKLMLGDTDTRNFTITNEDGPVNLTRFDRTLFVMKDNDGHYVEIICGEQDRKRTTFVPKERGGVAVKFTPVNISYHGFYECQFKISNSDGTLTYPIDYKIIAQISNSVKR